MEDPLVVFTGKHAGRSHSIWGASKADRWFPCPGSIRMEQELGGEGAPSSYATEGKAMHALAERCLRTGRPASDGLGDEFEGVAMEDEHCEAVQVYLDTIRDDWLNDGGELLVEHRFDLSEVWDGLFGTNDACLIGNRLLRVYDFKGGKGVFVPAVENKQLLIYGVGAYRALQSKYEFDKIELVIVQPRCPASELVRRWEINVVDLWEWIEVLRAALNETMKPDAPLNPGHHCIFCPAKPRCPAIADWALAQARMDFGSAPPVPTLLTPAEVLALLPKVELMDVFISAVRAHALALAEGGVDLPGWKLVPKRATRRWKDPEGAKQYLLRNGMTPLQVMEDPELRSPAQMEKVAPKHLRHMFKAQQDGGPVTLVHAVSSGHNLVATADIREPLRPAIEGDFKRLDD